MGSFLSSPSSLARTAARSSPAMGQRQLSHAAPSSFPLVSGTAQQHPRPLTPSSSELTTVLLSSPTDAAVPLVSIIFYLKTMT